ncbi:hypothetical protein LDENG_00143210 [Lucifuga dentata]|nr:hypothetical protein LDENG_00143210 [Lucifuga dentata]
MVSFLNGDGGSETLHKRRRTSSKSPQSEALTPVQQRPTVRHRKQKIMSRLSDSGFEEEFGSSPKLSPARTTVSPIHPEMEAETPAGRLSNWYLQYGDVGHKIQREREAQLYPCKSLARQPQLTAEARCKLVSWLIPVHKYFHLSFECCCLAVNIMDRFLASTPVAADCFQLLGVTALLLASKQVEVSSPRISHLLSLCCDTFTKEQLCNLECLVLIRLNFCLAAPTLAFFLDYYTNCIEATQLLTAATGHRSAHGNRHTTRPRQCSSLARKVCELSLADYAFNKYPPSLTAGCALRLANELLMTEQGLAEPTECQLMQSQEDQWNSLMDELYKNNQSIEGNASAQTAESPEVCEDNSVAVEDHVNSSSQEHFIHSLAQECRENLKLLVSLNHETLQIMSTM